MKNNRAKRRKRKLKNNNKDNTLECIYPNSGVVLFGSKAHFKHLVDAGYDIEEVCKNE